MGVSGKPAGGMGKAVRFADPAGRVRKPWMPERRPPMPISAEVVRVCEECGHGYAAGNIFLFENGRRADALRKMRKAASVLEKTS
jgi:hypothetical protein